MSFLAIKEPRREKTGLRGFRPGLAQTQLYSHRRRLGVRNFGFKKNRNYTIVVAKTKALISFAVTHDAAQITMLVKDYLRGLDTEKGTSTQPSGEGTIRKTILTPKTGAGKKTN